MTEKPQDIGMDSKSSLERDQIDLNHEIAGLQTGRIQRFLSDDSHGVYGESEKKKAERQFSSMLQMLLAEDAQYRALYTQVSDALDNAYQAVSRALIDINQRFEDSDRNLQYLRENTAEMEDGTKIFLSNEGSIYTEDGKRLSDEEALKYRYLDNLQSWDELKAEQVNRDDALRQKIEVNNYKSGVLDHATSHLENENDPPSMDELEAINRDISQGMPDLVREHLYNNELATHNPSLSAAHDLVEETKLSVPDLSADFDLARIDVPDIGPEPTVEPAYIRTLS